VNPTSRSFDTGRLAVVLGSTALVGYQGMSASASLTVIAPVTLVQTAVTPQDAAPIRAVATQQFTA